MIIAIVAIADNLAIGRDGALPWHYSSDLKFFKRTTSGHTIVMGYNTWLSIGRPLPNRRNIVLSRSRELSADSGGEIVRRKSEIVDLAMAEDVYIIGGAGVYADFIDVIDRWIVTRIPENVDDADTFMPADFLAGFTEIGSEEIGEGLVARTYERLRPVAER